MKYHRVTEHRIVDQWGHRWIKVNPKFIYFVPASATNWDVQINWMQEHYGEIGEGWDYHRTKFWFTNERDKLVFVLMWT